MKQRAKYLILLWLLFLYNYGSSITKLVRENSEYKNIQATSGVILFYSNGSVFAPVIVLNDSAQVLWTWADDSTATSLTPVKNYGSSQLRINKLKVIPWSAVRRINIGYDAQDGGSPEIESVSNQYVSRVENLNLVAPNLKEWCSSYNMLTTLDFNDFVNLETIECFLSQSLQNVSLINTPNLKRACFVVNGLQRLDLTDCQNLEEILAGSNKLTDIILPKHAENLWYLGSRENFQLTNQNIFNDLSEYPNLAHLSIWNANQKGELFIPKSNPTKWIWIRAYQNKYSSIDLRGSLLDIKSIGYVDMHKNRLTKVEIGGCKQIRTLDLSENLLSQDTVDYVLKQLDEFGPEIIDRYVNLSNNNPPSEIGFIYKKNLESKGWTVIVDNPTLVKSNNDSEDYKIYPNPSDGKFKLHINKISKEGAIVEISDIQGHKLIAEKMYKNDLEWSLTQFPGSIFIVTIINDHVIKSLKISKI